jgi:hypothetical protein
MKIHTMEQRTPEWDAVRKGKITASVAAKMITPTGKPSTQAKPFIGRLIAEQRGLQEPESIPVTEDIQTGIDQEEESRLWLQVELGKKVQQVGFIESDDGDSGFSPDGIISERWEHLRDEVIPVELKNPKPSTHIGYLLDGGLPNTYKAQCHFALVITDAPYMYFMSYCPGLPAMILKVERDDYTDKVKAALKIFKKDLESANQIIGE